jgi:uncharacterized membrane protein YvbJ
MTYCRNCGTQLANNVNFCYKCGASQNPTIILYCRNCGTQLANDAKYCYKCGTPTTGSIAIQPQTPVIIHPLTAPQMHQETYEKLPNNVSHNESFLIVTAAILVITIITLIIAIVAFSPFIDIFNNQTFKQPGINTVKTSIQLLCLLI